MPPPRGASNRFSAERRQTPERFAPPRCRPTTDGSVWLDIGRVSGVGVGSEFTSTIPDSKGQSKSSCALPRLEGIARSSASSRQPAGR
jgi:hypothetical protein